MKKLLLISAAFALSYAGNTQRRNSTTVVDTSKKTVVVTSAFKPSLKPAAKINFSAATLAVDTSSKPKLQYNVPAQNLFFTYQPASLKPLALSVDSANEWINQNYIKLGVGNFSTPFAQAGLSFGDGKRQVINVHAKHISQKGKLPFQQYNKLSADVIGVFSSGEQSNNEVTGGVGFEKSTQYYYGYEPETLKFTKDDLRQRYTNLHATIGIRNKEVNAYGISYAPTANISFFKDNRSGNETNLVLDAPITKTFGRVFGLNLGLTADITSYKPGKGDRISNNLFYLTPALLFKTPNISVHAGFRPAWDNQIFSMLPDFTATAKLNEERFVLLAGWIGYFQKNTYQSLASFNPWIAQPDNLFNTRIREQYVGFKGSAASHFTYNARVSVLRFSNAALFVNDTTDGKTFLTTYEPDMKAIRLHGEVAYTVQEKFSLLAGATINQYTGLNTNEKAWGLLPFEVTGALRWQILKDLYFKTDVFFWDGPQYRSKDLKSFKQKPAIDLSPGVEFTIMPKLSLWVQFNNILNNRYERWNQYQVLGFNVMGGIVYSFSQFGK